MLIESKGERLRRLFGKLIIFYDEANGKIISKHGEIEAEFILFQLHSGNILIEAKTSSNGMELTGRNTFQNKSFLGVNCKLESETDNGLLFNVNKAMIISTPHLIYRNQSDQNPQCLYHWLFRINAGEHLQLRSEETDSHMIKYKFALTNVTVLPNSRWDWGRGQYILSWRKCYSDDHYEMMTQQIPMVTGSLTIEAYDDDFSFDEAQQVARDMSYLLSLAEGNLVSIPQARLFSEQGIVQEIHAWERRVGQPKPGFNTLNKDDIGNFINTVFPDFHARDSSDKESLGITFEYYLLAKESDILEKSFSNGFAVFERLTRHYKGNKLGAITEDTKEKIKKELHEIIKNSKEQDLINTEENDLLKGKIENIFNRPLNFREKLEKLISEHNIKYKDICPDNIENLQDYSNRLSGLRNDIIHRGKVKESKHPNLYKTRDNFIILLDRSIFAVLGYDYR